MMSNALHRLGRFAARRPWAVITSWLVLSVLVVGAAAAVGQELEDSFGAPGLDSQGATVVLLALAAPVVDMQVGTPDDGSLPENRTQRQAYDLVADGFGPGANGPLVVAVDISQDPGVVAPLQDAIASDAGIASVATPMIDRSAGVATLIAVPTTGPQDDATPATIERLRAEVFPDALGDSPARAHVGGQTATFADVGGKVAD